MRDLNTAGYLDYVDTVFAAVAQDLLLRRQADDS
jgi:hypothetical protein